MSKPHPIFPKNPALPSEAPGHLNLGFLRTNDDGYYVVPTLTWFEKNVNGASEAELDMFYAVVRAHRRRWLVKSILAAILLCAFLSIPCYFLPHATHGFWPFN